MAFTETFTISVTVTGGGVTVGAVSLSGTGFVGGAPGGTVVGALSAPVTGGSGTPTFTVDDTTHFTVSGNNLVLAGTEATGNYPINVTVHLAGAVGDGVSYPFTVLGVALPPSGTLQAVVNIPDTYTRRGVLQQAAGTYVFNETAATPLDPWVDPDGRFTITKSYCRVAGCCLRVYFVRVSGGLPSVEFRLGDWQGTGIGDVKNAQGWNITLNLNRLSVSISDQTGTLYSQTFTSNNWPNGTPDPTQPKTCAMGWTSGWRWVSWTAATWPYKRSIASLRAQNLIPAMDPTQIGLYPGTPGPGPYTYPAAQPPNSILGMNYSGGQTGTGDALAGMMMSVDAHYIFYEEAADLASMMAVADSAHNFPIIVLDNNTQAIADMWNSDYRTEMFVPNQGGPTSNSNTNTINDVLYTNTTGAPIDVGAMMVVDSVNTSQWFPIYSYWWTNPTTIVPAGGSLICTCFGRLINTVFNGDPPAGTASLAVPVTGLSVQWVANSYVAGSMTFCDASHNNMHSWLTYLVTGDPYFLEGAHGLAVNGGVAGCGMPYPALLPTLDGTGYRPNGRYTCWALRDYYHALICTPAVTPTWVMPRASFQKTVNCIMNGFNWWQTTTPSPSSGTNDNLRQIFRVMLNSSQIEIAIWQEDYVGQCLGEMSRYYHGTLWDTILDWWMPSPIARLNGTSGWCNSTPTGYNPIFGTNTTVNGLNVVDWVGSWGDAWNLQLGPPNNYSVCTVPADMQLISEDYVGGLWAALCLAVQAGQARSPAPAWLADALTVKALMKAALNSNVRPGWATFVKQGYA